MLTYTTAKSLLQQMSKVPSDDTTNTALLLQLWNDSRRTVAGINGGKWPWLEIDGSARTVASQEYVEVPNNIRRVITVRQQNGDTVGSVIYPIRLIFDQQRWDGVLAMLLGESDVPFFGYQRSNRLYIQPIPSTSDYIVYMRGRAKVTDLSIEDYTTGTIVSIANGATTVTGSGTSWTAGMVGQYIRIDSANAANKGDNAWYEISSVTSTTVLELVKKYQGTSIAAGSATYTIGQITYEPETYQMAPIYRALWQFFLVNDPLHPERWTTYAKLYDGGVEAGLATQYGGLISQMLEEANESMEGNYIPPIPREGMGRSNWPPYWFPHSDGSGF